MTLDPTLQQALAGVILALLGLVAEKLRRQSKFLHEAHTSNMVVREQVQNSHKTNLRDDIDGVLAALDRVLEGQREHGQEFGHIRRELQQERVERQALSERLDGHLTTVASVTAATVAAVVGGTHS